MKMMMAGLLMMADIIRRKYKEDHMGTNYYFVTKSRRIAHKYFAEVESWGTYDEEYKLCDIPDFHYEIHLNKLSWGWRPLFQKHKAFQTFAQLEEFYLEHQKYLKIYDEYEQEYTWDKYKQKIIDHAIFIKDGVLVMEGAAEELRMERGKSIVDLYKEIYAE